MGKGLAAKETFDPAVWEAVGYFYRGDDEDMMASYDLDHRNLDLAGLWPMVEDRAGACESCGTRYSHGAVLRNDDGTYLLTGQICAFEWFGLPSVQAVKRKEAQRRKEARERREQVAEFIENHDLAEALATDHRIVRDIARKLETYGSLTERQVALVRKLHAEAVAPPEPEAEKGTVPEGTVEIAGVVVSVKIREGFYGWEHKMLVVCADQEGREWRVWGTVPRAIDNVQRGDRVALTATVTRSDDDPAFGFYKRPRKASCVAAELRRLVERANPEYRSAGVGTSSHRAVTEIIEVGDRVWEALRRQ